MEKVDAVLILHGLFTIFKVWMVIFAVVGAQMGWILRPFIGSPDMPFTLFRERESNFFMGILEQIKNLFS